MTHPRFAAKLSQQNEIGSIAKEPGCGDGQRFFFFFAGVSFLTTFFTNLLNADFLAAFFALFLAVFLAVFFLAFLAHPPTAFGAFFAAAFFGAAVVVAAFLAAAFFGAGFAGFSLI